MPTRSPSRFVQAVAAVLAAFTGVVAAVTAPQAATIPYSSFYVLGDSLSDDGNVYRLTFRREPPSPPYYDGRFTDGPNWFDRVAAEARADGLTTGNFAYGGARAVPDVGVFPDLPNQRRLYLREGGRGADPLVAIFIGGNDLLAAIGNPGARIRAREAADAVYAAGASLGRNGVSSAMLLNLPNFARIPRYAGEDPELRRSARQATRAYNRRLAVNAEALRSRGMEIIEVDVYGLFQDVVRRPAAYGIDDLTTPCLVDGRRCGADEAAGKAFFDQTHPSAAMHGHLADIVLDLLRVPEEGPAPAASAGMAATSAAPAPVPLPGGAGLMLTALAFGAVFRLRRPRAG